MLLPVQLRQRHGARQERAVRLHIGQTDLPVVRVIFQQAELRLAGKQAGVQLLEQQLLRRVEALRQVVGAEAPGRYAPGKCGGAQRHAGQHVQLGASGRRTGHRAEQRIRRASHGKRAIPGRKQASGDRRCKRIKIRRRLKQIVKRRKRHAGLENRFGAGMARAEQEEPVRRCNAPQDGLCDRQRRGQRSNTNGLHD